MNFHTTFTYQICTGRGPTQSDVSYHLHYPKFHIYYFVFTINMILPIDWIILENN